MTNGNAVPSLRPASPVSAKRSRSRSVGFGDLHVGGEHRIGRREDAAEQDRRAQRQAEPGDAGARRCRATVTTIETIARRSGSSQRPSLRPTLIFSPEPNSDSSTTTSAIRSSARACDGAATVQPVEPERADGHADREIEHRRAERQAREQRIAERHDEKQEAGDGRPPGDFHATRIPRRTAKHLSRRGSRLHRTVRAFTPLESETAMRALPKLALALPARPPWRSPREPRSPRSTSRCGCSSASPPAARPTSPRA